MRLSLALIVIAVLGRPAFAEDAHAPSGASLFVKDHDAYRPATDNEIKAAAGTSDAHGHGEPKGGLDFTGFKRYDLGIYTLVVFGLLLLILNRFAWPHIAAGLQKREAAILGARE
jgi:hypothetical protein